MRGIRLNFVVEGQTEEAFVKKVLAPHLGNLSIWANARSVQTSRKRNIKHRGGIVRYAQAHHDIARWMREQSGPDVRFTTMFDLFRLPRDFPSNEAPTPVDPRERVDALQQALLEDIDDDRLLPYIPRIPVAGQDDLVIVRQHRIEDMEELLLRLELVRSTA